jgi:uncharacterized protein (DUF849 family)
MLLKCCLNGARLRAEHPALPVSAAELSRDAARVVAAGADALHVHAKDERGRDTLDAGVVAAVLTAIREQVPGVPVGLTTGAWIDPDPAGRVAAIRAWTVLPDFASVNWHEPGAEDVATDLLDRGVAVEAGVWHLEGLAAWSGSPLRNECIRVLIELGEGLDATATVAEADRILAHLPAQDRGRAPVLLHGQGSSAWPALGYAVTLSLQSRIGLEDVLTLPDGTPAPDNAALVAAARTVAGNA